MEDHSLRTEVVPGEGCPRCLGQVEEKESEGSFTEIMEKNKGSAESDSLSSRQHRSYVADFTNREMVVTLSCTLVLLYLSHSLRKLSHSPENWEKMTLQESLGLLFLLKKYHFIDSFLKCFFGNTGVNQCNHLLKHT